MKDKKAAFRQILFVFFALAILSGIEFAIALSLDNAAVPLFLIAFLKAGLIAQFFMHIYRLWREESH